MDSEGLRRTDVVFPFETPGTDFKLDLTARAGKSQSTVQTRAEKTFQRFGIILDRPRGAETIITEFEPEGAACNQTALLKEIP